MKRDMELARSILLAVEQQNRPDQTNTSIAVAGHDDLSVYHHVQLLHQAGFLRASERKAMDVYAWYPIALTWDGHEFLDEIRDPERWKKTKAGADAVKSWSLDTFKDIAKGLVKKQIEEWSGVKV